MTSDRPYPDIMYSWPAPPREVPVEEFVSQQEAADELGVRMFTIGRLIAERRLAPATYRGLAGVTRESLQMEAQARRQGGRLKRLMKSLGHWASP